MRSASKIGIFAACVAAACCSAIALEVAIVRSTGKITQVARNGYDWGTAVTNGSHYLVVRRNPNVVQRIRDRWPKRATQIAAELQADGFVVNPVQFVVTNIPVQVRQYLRANVTVISEYLETHDEVDGLHTGLLVVADEPDGE